MDADGQDGNPDVQHIHDGLDEHEEHGEDDNDNIVVCNTGRCQHGIAVKEGLHSQ